MERAPPNTLPVVTMELRNLSDPTFATVWFRGHPYPVSARPRGPHPADAAWYVLLSDGQWYRVRERREGELSGDRWTAVEEDVLAWLETYAASPPAPSADDDAPRELAAPNGALLVRPLAFDAGAFAADFIRRLNVLFDGRATRLIIPSMPVVIYGPALMDSTSPVTLYAGRGALALATYVGLPFPMPGPEVDASSLSDVGVIFGPVSPIWDNDRVA